MCSHKYRNLIYHIYANTKWYSDNASQMSFETPNHSFFENYYLF